MASRKRKILAVTLLILLVIIFIVLPAGIAYASLHPSRCKVEKSWEELGFKDADIKEFTVKTDDGVELKGYDIGHKGAEKPLIFIVMHGYTSCMKSDYVVAASLELFKRGYRVVLFDFRAHGESGGSETTIGPLEAKYDAPAVIKYVESHHPGRPIALLGYSMGAVVAIMAGNNVSSVKVIIADAPYPLLNTVIPRWLKSKMGIPTWYSRLIGMWGGLLTGMSLDYGPIKLDKINKPLLVIVGDKDPLLTPEEAKEIAAKSVHGKAIIVQGAGHVESVEKLGTTEYVNKIEEFIQETIPWAITGAGLAVTPHAQGTLAAIYSTA
ncbi:MAG: alpha/beta hydrolase [Desulfurococcales archaeon]|nr:alpha/beta hydrolase [Desulfurococcales archaeon]